MSALRDALDQILIECNGSRTYTRRIQHIHEIAMHALGVTLSQRTARHEAIFERVGDDPGLKAYQERMAKRAARIEDRYGDEAVGALP